MLRRERLSGISLLVVLLSKGSWGKTSGFREYNVTVLKTDWYL